MEIKKHLKFILFVIVIIFLMCNFYCNYVMFCVSSGSMYPTLKINDIVIVRKQKKYFIDDIITYFDESFNGYVTHRIIDIKNGKFITKGDSNNVVDKNPVNDEQIVGKVILKSRILWILYKYRITLIIIISLILILERSIK